MENMTESRLKTTDQCLIDQFSGFVLAEYNTGKVREII